MINRSGKSEKLILGLDLDGVIIDHAENKIRLAREFGFEITSKETPSDVMKHKMPRDVWEKIQTLIYDDPTIGLSPSIITGAESGLGFLKENGFNYFLISRRKTKEIPIELLKQKHLWGNYFNETNTFFVKDKEGKNEKARELGINVYIDDQPSVLEKLLSVDEKILFDEYGVFQEDGDYRRIRTWSEFLEILKDL